MESNLPLLTLETNLFQELYEVDDRNNLLGTDRFNGSGGDRLRLVAIIDKQTGQKITKGTYSKDGHQDVQIGWEVDKKFIDASQIRSLDPVKYAGLKDQGVACALFRLGSGSLSDLVRKSEEKFSKRLPSLIETTPIEFVDSVLALSNLVYGVLQQRPQQSLWKTFRQNITNLFVALSEFREKNPDQQLMELAYPIETIIVTCVIHDLKTEKNPEVRKRIIEEAQNFLTALDLPTDLKRQLESRDLFYERLQSASERVARLQTFASDEEWAAIKNDLEYPVAIRNQFIAFPVDSYEIEKSINFLMQANALRFQQNELAELIHPLKLVAPTLDNHYQNLTEIRDKYELRDKNQ